MGNAGFPSAVPRGCLLRAGQKRPQRGFPPLPGCPKPLFQCLVERAACLLGSPAGTAWLQGRGAQSCALTRWQSSPGAPPRRRNRIDFSMSAWPPPSLCQAPSWRTEAPQGTHPTRSTAAAAGPRYPNLSPASPEVQSEVVSVNSGIQHLKKGSSQIFSCSRMTKSCLITLLSHLAREERTLQDLSPERAGSR